MVLSDDSAEREHLIGAGPGFGDHRRHHHKRVHMDLVEDEGPAAAAGGGAGAEELTAGGAGPDLPGNPMSDDVITVEFHSPAPDPDPTLGGPPGVPQPQRQKAGGPTAWTLSDFYDYLSPDDDLSAVGATPEPEPSPSPPADMEDENPLLAGSPAAPAVPAAPEVPDRAPGVRPPLTAPPMPGLEQGEGLGGAMGADGCRLGFVRSGPGVCVSQCETEPNFCFNGGVCTVVAGMGAFCR